MSENKTKIIVETETSAARSELLDVQAAQDAVAKSAKDAGDTGAAGFRVLGGAAKKVAEELGVSGRAAHQVGTTIANMAQSALPSMGTALGIVGVALAAGLVLWNQYENAQKTAREEMIKLGETAAEWTRQTEVSKNATEELTKAEYALYIALRPGKLDALNEGIAAQEKQIASLKKEQSGYIVLMDGVEQVMYTDNKRVDQLNKLINATERKISVDRVLASELANAPKTYAEFKDPTGRDNAAEELAVQQNDQVTAWTTYMNQEAVFEQRILDTQLNFDRERIQAKQDEAKQEIDIEKQKNTALASLSLNYYQGSLNVASQALDAYMAVTGKRNAALFLMQKALAIGQIWVDTQRGAMAAAASVAGIPLVGPAMAAAAYSEMQTLGAISMGIAAAAAIGQVATGTWKGGGGAGGGAVGSYPASPGTGQPAGQTGINLTLIIDGKPTYVGDLMEGIANEIDRNNGSIGRIQIAYQRNV